MSTLFCNLVVSADLRQVRVEERFALPLPGEPIVQFVLARLQSQQLVLTLNRRDIFKHNRLATLAEWRRLAA